MKRGVGVLVAGLALVATLPSVSPAQEPVAPPGDTTLRTDSATVPAPPPRKGHKNPVLSFGLSALVPGVGQAYNGQMTKARIIWAGTVASLFLTMRGAGSCALSILGALSLQTPAELHCRQVKAGAYLFVGFQAFSVVDAQVSSILINRNRARRASLEVAPGLGVVPGSGLQLRLVRVRF